MRFLVVEGLDGSGKSTQVALLRKYLEEKSIKYKYLHFPRLEKGVYGKLVARFLRGEMGDNDHVDPYLVALIFAGDRRDAAAQIYQWIEDGYLVLIDRYVYSNIAFQCAKLKTSEEQNELANWILELEFENHRLPIPDMNILLDVPFEFTRERLSAQREGEDREYLKGQTDIHEDDLDFQKRVREIYHSICLERKELKIINCSDEQGNMNTPDQIFEKLIRETGL